MCRVDTMTALSVHLLPMPSVKQRYWEHPTTIITHMVLILKEQQSYWATSSRGLVQSDHLVAATELIDGCSTSTEDMVGHTNMQIVLLVCHSIAVLGKPLDERVCAYYIPSAPSCIAWCWHSKFLYTPAQLSNYISYLVPLATIQGNYLCGCVDTRANSIWKLLVCVSI